MVHIGIIGCGKIAQVRHIPEYAAHPEAELAGFYDLNRERAAQLAERYGGKAYESVEAMLEDAGIDAVSVCTANHVHAPISIAALKAGKDVLCEKPMAVTLEECEAMAAAARETGRLLMIGHNQRLTKAHIKAKQLIEQGEIGRIITARTTFGHGGPEAWSIDAGKNVWFFDKKRASMGAMADLGIHKTDLLQFLCGAHITKVTACIRTLDKCDAGGAKISVDDNAVCIYELQNGVVATMTASWSYYGAEDNSTVLYGTEGIMRIYDDPAHSIVIRRKSGETYLYDMEAIQTNDHQTASGVIDLWMDCLLKRRESEISGEEALHAMRAVFAAIRSSEQGKTVAIAEGN